MKIIKELYNKIWAALSGIFELVIPTGCKEVYCYNNQLTKLILPNDCEIVYCRNNKLNVLVIPDSCKKVWADMKSITELNKVKKLDLWI